MPITRQEISHVYNLLGRGDIENAVSALGLLRIVPIPGFGQGLLPRLLFTVVECPHTDQIHILRMFVDCLARELTEEEMGSLDWAELNEAARQPFFEFHERFFELWLGTLNASKVQSDLEVRVSVLSSLSGALGTIWRPALYTDWASKGPALAVWLRATDTLHTVLSVMSSNESAWASARELVACAANVVGLYQDVAAQRQILGDLLLAARQTNREAFSSSLWNAAEVWGRRPMRMLRLALAKRAMEPPIPTPGGGPRPQRPHKPALTAAYPSVVLPGSWYLMEMFLYAKEYQDIVEREIQKLEQVQGRQYESARTYLASTLPEGTEISIAISSEDFDVTPDHLEFRWFEDFNHFPFRIRLKSYPVREEGGDIRVHVYAHDLPIGQVNLHLGLATGSSIPKINTARMQWYERVFASYAHEDFAIVEWYRDLCKDLEITMFVDKSGLQAGEPWEGTLLKQIRASDIFYLFWSRAARRSKYVTREWHAALDLIHVKGETFLRPMFWESPMPIAPSKLAPFHFRQISLGGHADIGRPDVSPDDSHDPKRELRTKKINQAMETGAKKQRGSSPKR